MRKQYYSRPSDRGDLVWDVNRLVELSSDFPRKEVQLTAIREFNENFWFQDATSEPTFRAVADHARLIQETDLRYPIILAADGRVMDGMHRVAKVHIEGRSVIQAVQFPADPEPDFVGVDIDTLPYGETT